MLFYYQRQISACCAYLPCLQKGITREFFVIHATKRPKRGFQTNLVAKQTIRSASLHIGCVFDRFDRGFHSIHSFLRYRALAISILQNWKGLTP